MRISAVFVLAYSVDTDITTQVPATHTINAQVYNGEITINGETLSGVFTLTIPHGQTVEISFRPYDGYTVSMVLINGEAIPYSGYRTAITGDIMISAVASEEAPPKTSDRSEPMLWAVLAVSSAVLISGCLIGAIKKKRK